ncbi:MAG: hypothetical protein CEN90_308 [Parcubacteria group bacterium Licking1014_17]|nr:MAG: hypothetical protein CEN90_308 [Parcubacteria group bacterium Licking1014_17]
MYRKEIIFLFLFAVVLSLFGTVLHLTGKTFLPVDQIYCRGYYPWSSLNPPVNCSQERDGDYIFESNFIAGEIDYLAKNSYQNSYTERVMNGYPITAGYTGNAHTLTRLFNKFLPTTSSANFSALAYLFISFTLGYLIARSLKFEIFYSVIFGFLSITCSYFFLGDAYNMSLIGYEMATLGMVQFYFYFRKRLFIFLATAGFFCILLSAFFQLYLYAGLCFVLLGVGYFFAAEKKRYLVMLIVTGILFGATALVLNFSLERHLSFLSVSNKLNIDLSLSELLKHKDYALDPLGWIGYEPIKFHRKLTSVLFGNSQFYGLYGSNTAGVFSPGPVFLILFFIGIYVFWRRYRGYTTMVLFWLLYFTGITQFILSVIIGSPFREETSIRASGLFFLLGSFATVYALRSLIRGEFQLSKRAQWIIGVALLYMVVFIPVFAVFRYLRHRQILIEAIYISASSAIFLLGMFILSRKNPEANQGLVKSIATFLIVLSLIIPSFARLFLRAAPVAFAINSSKLFYPETEFGSLVKKYPEIDRVALIQTPKGARVHQNSPLQLGLSTITGYRNPMYSSYADLFNYHRFIFEKNLDPSVKFDEFKKSVAYLNNDLGTLRMSEPSIKFSEATNRYFVLNGVNTVIGSEDLIIRNPEWEKLFTADRLSLWQRKTNYPEYTFVRKEKLITERNEALSYFFSSNWNPNEFAIVTEPVLKNQETISKHFPQLKILKKDDGYRLIEIKNNDLPGILILPVTYDKYWKAFWGDGNVPPSQPLKTFLGNVTYLGVLIPEGSGIVEIKYQDQPGAINLMFGIIGIIIFGTLLFLFLKNNTIVSVSASEK